MKRENNIVLRIDDLSIGYGKKTILSNINLDLKRGELVCLMGQNGKGKSTFLKSIVGLQPLLRGQIFINDQLIDQLNSLARAKKISLVLTDRPVSGNLTVHDLISIGRYPYLGWNVKLSDEDHAKVNGAIDQVNLTGLENEKLDTLSDGQLQKTMIARALAQDGELMILDEPTAHLDLNNRIEIMYLLKKLSRDEKKSIVMATHELDLALQMADKTWLIDNQGQIKQGVPEDLILNGSMDEVFGHKGYNLKTGRISHITEGKKVQIEGSDYSLLWTKNALERNGFNISEEAEILIQIDEKKNSYILKYSGIDKLSTCNSIEELLNELLSESN